MFKKIICVLIIGNLSFLQAQEKLITGIVSDASGPLIGVSILIKGTTIETNTDFEGKYSINANIGDTLVYFFIGMKTEERMVKNTSKINVLMKEDGNVLDEVVVSAYGIKRKSKVLGYSVHTVTAQQLSTQRDSYAKIKSNGFKRVLNSPLSTFSIDVDNASYSNIRRMINNGEEIPKDAVKIEEMINYFDYNYPQPKGKIPFSINSEVIKTPWNNKTRLVRIGLKGKEIDQENLPASNLIFLIDVSGSMSDYNKLPLLKKTFKLLVKQLREKDNVSIVVYAGAAGVVLEPTNGSNKEKILAALNKLESGGSTAGGEGLELAYKLAEKNFLENGNNRIILATDGDFNVGETSNSTMEKLIEEKRKSGVFLSVLGFGYGNYQDDKLEILANKGNGNHAYIDTMQEAQKVFGKEFGGTLFTIAKDVKIQVEFNPKKVQAYRLIGYENRLLNDQDFVDDTKDAGELGSGHTVTALYEIIPVGINSEFIHKLPKLKYTKKVLKENYNEELLTVKFRYKKPAEKRSKELVKVIKDQVMSPSNDMIFASAVALFGMQLRDSEFANKTNKKDVISLINTNFIDDKNGYKSEFKRLVKSYSK